MEPALPEGEVCPAHMQGDDPLSIRLRETYSRIAHRVHGVGEEEKEACAALAWCRANGNPHKDQPHD